MAKPSNLRIEDVGAADARADLNDILISIASLQTTDGSGTGYSGEPTTTYPNMLWYDKATDILKMRSEADDAWITLGTLDQSLDTFAASIALATQAEAEAGTNNTKAMTPLRVEQAVVDRFNITGSAPTYACRAWVNFNGIGTVAIRASGNVSSITDNGVGQYTVNFTTAMPDANYAVCASHRAFDSSNNSLLGLPNGASFTTTSFSVRSNAASNTTSLFDIPEVCLSIFR